MFELTSQMRRCVVSITSNIAEGFGIKSYKEKINFFFISKGSLVELQNQLIISKDIGFLDENKFNIIYNQSVEVYKILNNLITKSRTKL